MFNDNVKVWLFFSRNAKYVIYYGKVVCLYKSNTYKSLNLTLFSIICNSKDIIFEGRCAALYLAVYTTLRVVCMAPLY